MRSYNHFPALPIDEAAFPGEGLPQPLKICIATQDYLYLIKNGGIGTSFHHTACILAERGCDVTILFCNFTDHLTSDQIAEARDRLTPLGIKLETLFPASFGAADLHEFFPADIITVSSYTAYHRLKQRDFDLILFPDWRGLGYYSLLGKRLGLAFRQTAIWVQAHSTCLWHALANEQPGYSEHDVRVYHMEREAVRMADLLVSPTHYLLDWKERHGFVLPAETYVQPYLLTGALGHHPTERRRVSDIAEIVFFGRLEKRKGLHIFVQAIKRLIHEEYGDRAPAELTVTFLGKITEVEELNSYDYLMARLGGLGLKIKILPALHATEAIAYLQAARALAVIPSVTDNSPLTVLECIHNAIPFVAAATGGIPEIIAPEDHATVLFKFGVRSLSEKLLEVLRHGASTAFPAIRQAEDNIPAWLGAVRASVAQQRAQAPVAADAGESGPLISVCITHFERPRLLKVTLDGLRAQTYKNFEVIIVDDGSRTVEARAYLEQLEQGAVPLPITIIRQKNEFVGAARNKALARARGEYIVFMDDDNFAYPEQLQTYLTAIRHSGYDALTCAAIAFPEDQDPRALEHFIHLYIPLGSGMAANLFDNSYGDANGIFRAAFLREIGGFTEDEGLSWEDYELFAKIEVSQGKIAMVPEPLMGLRATAGSVSRRGSMLANHYRALRPAMAAFPWASFGDSILVALNGAFARNAPVFSPEQRGRSLAEKQLTATTEFSLPSLRWLVRRMAERQEDDAVITTLMDHYDASPTFAFNLIECLCFCLDKGMSFPRILDRMGSGCGRKALLRDLADALISKDSTALGEFLVEREPAIGRTLDGQILLAKIALLSGKATDALLRLNAAFADVEAGYLLRNRDIRQIVTALDTESRLNTTPLRSGLHHWLVNGQFEGRVVNYARPLAAPFALSDNEGLHAYETRLKEAADLPREDRAAIYAQLLHEALEINAPLVLADLAAVIIRDANLTYLEDYPDVITNWGGDMATRGVGHYHTSGREEGRSNILQAIERRDYGAAYDRWRAARKPLLQPQPQDGRHSFTASFAGALGR